MPLRTDRFAHSVVVEKATHIFRVIAIHSFSDQAAETQLSDKVHIRLFGSSEKLGAYVEVGIHPSCSVKKLLSNVYGGRMAVVNPEAIEHASQELGVLDHMLPEVGAVLGTSTVSQLDAIVPYDNLSSDVRSRGSGSKVFKCVCIPDPAIVGKAQRAWVVLLGSLILGQASEQGLREWLSAQRASVSLNCF